jgi:hypothetical protein
MMGYTQLPDRTLPVTDARFVAHGLRYVFGAVAYIGLLVVVAMNLGSRIPMHGILAYSLTGIAATIFLFGVALLASFFGRRLIFGPRRAGFGKIRLHDGLWDEQLDGLEDHGIVATRQ